MGDTRTPTAVLEARGSFVKNPKLRAARELEPKPTGPLGAPPKHLSPPEKKTWKELSKILPEGVAMNTDGWVVEMAVRLMTRERGQLPPPLLCSERGQLIACLMQLGMTPVSRSKVAVVPTKSEAEDDFAEFNSSATAGQ
jgi:phage terminase small subunit